MIPVCSTTQKGKQCLFAMPNGCAYPAKSCVKIIDECVGCGKVVNEEYCTAYPDPVVKWKHGHSCPMATHIVKAVEEKKKLNPIKASKKGKK